MRITDLGLLPPDHPIYREGPQLFTPRRFAPPAAPTPKPAEDGPTRKIPHHTWTEEDYRRNGEWQVGTFHRIAPDPQPDTPAANKLATKKNGGA